MPKQGSCARDCHKMTGTTCILPERKPCGSRAKGLAAQESVMSEWEGTRVPDNIDTTCSQGHRPCSRKSDLRNTFVRETGEKERKEGKRKEEGRGGEGGEGGREEEGEDGQEWGGQGGRGRWGTARSHQPGVAWEWLGQRSLTVTTRARGMEAAAQSPG